MDTLRKTCLLVALNVICISSITYSQQDEKWKLNLRFEKSETVRRMTARALKSYDRPSYVAEIFFKSPEHFDLGKGSSVGRALSRKGYQSIASKVASGTIGSFRREPNGVTVFSLYDTDEDNIKLTAQVLVNCLNEMAYEEFEKIEKELDGYQKEKVELEKEISRLTDEKDKSTAQFEELKKIVPYRSADDAQESMREFNKICQFLSYKMRQI